jgi:hypothetical protein
VTDVLDTAVRPSARPRTPEARSRQRTVAVALALVALMACSFAAEVAALHRDLPIQDTDEDWFVTPAVHIAATGDLNPHWFGHPGSTVIYPIAGLVHVWDFAFHDGPLIGSHRALEQRFADDPTSFYVIARLWTIALAVAIIPMLYLLGRQAFNRRVGLIGATLWTFLPYGIRVSRVVRTESAAAFFGVVALYFCVRAWQEPRRRWWLIAGVSLGLAVASRFYMLALLPCLAAGAIVTAWPAWRRVARALGYAALGTLVGFVVSTPYFFFDLDQVRRDLKEEANMPHIFSPVLSPAGNARWYLTDAVPHSLTWAIYVAALVGIVIVLRRRIPYQLALVAFCAIFFVGLSAGFSALRFHFQRYAFQMLPVLVLFAAVTVHEVASWLGRRAPTAERRHTWSLAIATGLTAALLVAPLVGLVDVERVDRRASTRRLGREWMIANLPPGTRVLQDPRPFYIGRQTIPPIGHGIDITYGIDATRPLARYRHEGYDYVATPSGAPFLAMSQAATHPAAAEFYKDLACDNRLVASIKVVPGRPHEAGIWVFRLGQRPVKLLNMFCIQPDPPNTLAEQAR